MHITQSMFTNCKNLKIQSKKMYTTIITLIKAASSAAQKLNECLRWLTHFSPTPLENVRKP